MPRDKTDRTTLPHQSNWRSAISATSEKRNLVAYTAYGFSAPQQGLASSLGFNGERLNLPAAGYLLGNGYRLYSPSLMRFHSSDSLSPFLAGGLNSYAYCSGDPIGRIDPSGHAPLIFRPFARLYTWIAKKLNRHSYVSPRSSFISRASVATKRTLPHSDRSPSTLARHRNSIEGGEISLRSYSTDDSHYASASEHSRTPPSANSWASRESGINPRNLQRLHEFQTRTMEDGLNAQTEIERLVSIANAHHDVAVNTQRGSYYFNGILRELEEVQDAIRSIRERYPRHLANRIPNDKVVSSNRY